MDRRQALAHLYEMVTSEMADIRGQGGGRVLESGLWDMCILVVWM